MITPTRITLGGFLMAVMLITIGWGTLFGLVGTILLGSLTVINVTALIVVGWEAWTDADRVAPADLERDPYPFRRKATP